jgi:putative membrane protein
MQRFLLHWAVSAASLGVTSWLLAGVRITSLPALLVAALVLGFLNAVVKPLLLLLTLPITLLTLGLFYFVLNGIVFALAATLVGGFSVDGIGWAMLGALIMGFISLILGRVLRDPSRRRRES